VSQTGADELTQVGGTPMETFSFFFFSFFASSIVY
jgi:hypothetical protein